MLLHIGYHKTGTTWLQRVLFPQARLGLANCRDWPGFLSQLKRLVIYPEKFLPFECEELIGYELLYRRANGQIPIISAERLSGEPCHEIIDGFDIADKLRAIWPLAKVLIVVREQRSWLLSEYGNCIVSDSATLTMESYLASKIRIRHLEYDLLVSQYYSLFGEDAVLVLPYELFRQNPRLYVRKILEHTLGRNIEDQILNSIQFDVPVNVSLSPVELILRRYGNQIFGWSISINPSPISQWKLGRYYTKRLSGEIGSIIPKSINDRIRSSWQAQIDFATKGYFTESNLRLSTLISYDLNNFGYM